MAVRVAAVTVTVRATAVRCDRCQRVLDTVRPAVLNVNGSPAGQARLCVRCRGDLLDALNIFMRKGRPR